MAQESESRNLDKVIVRLPDGMRDRIKKSAERHGRSMNAEIVQALEQVFPAPVTTDYIAEAITEHFGERCSDYAEGCPCCEVWAQYDKMRGK